MQHISPDYDLALIGGTIFTGDAEQTILRDGVLGIRGGEIVHVGRTLPEDAIIGRKVDADGCYILPGFVNTHTHAILSMVRGVAADSGFAPSYTPGLPNGMDVDADQARALARLGALEALLFGTTLLGDNFVHADVTTEAMAELGLRLCPSFRVHDIDFARVAAGEWVYDPATGEAMLQATLDLHNRWHNHPRVNVCMAAHAADTCSEGFLKQIAEVAAPREMRVNTHIGQSKVEVERVAEVTGKTSVQVFEDAGLLNERLLAGHCIYMSDDDMARMARAGAHAVSIAKCNAASGRLAPLHKLRAAGVNLAMGTDTQNGDMVELMRWALITARLQEGGVSKNWQPAHVFEMANMGGARALGMADMVGSLEPGKRADIVVMDAARPHLTPNVRPLGNLVHNAQGRDVKHVLVDGEFLVEDCVPTRVSMEEICREAEEAARQLWGSCGAQYWLK